MKQSPLTQNSKTYFRNLTIIYFAMLCGQLAFVGVVLCLKLTSAQIVMNKLSFPFSFVLPVIAISCVIAGRLIYKHQIKLSQIKSEMIEKMQTYQSGIIIKLALIEGSSLFSIVVFLMTGEVFVLMFTLVLLLIFWTLKPSRQKAIEDLKLTPKEIEMIKNDDSIIYEVQSRF